MDRTANFGVASVNAKLLLSIAVFVTVATLAGPSHAQLFGGGGIIGGTVGKVLHDTIEAPAKKVAPAIAPVLPKIVAPPPDPPSPCNIHPRGCMGSNR